VVIFEIDAAEVEMLAFKWGGLFGFDHDHVLRFFQFEECLIDSRFFEVWFYDVELAEVSSA
jgi:hypothetical protein